jgi:hypothetical protein
LQELSLLLEFWLKNVVFVETFEEMIYYSFDIPEISEVYKNNSHIENIYDLLVSIDLKSIEKLIIMIIERSRARDRNFIISDVNSILAIENLEVIYDEIWGIHVVPLC